MLVLLPQKPSCRSRYVFANPRAYVEADICQPSLSLLNRNELHLSHLIIQIFYQFMLISPSISIAFSILKYLLRYN